MTVVITPEEIFIFAMTTIIGWSAMHREKFDDAVFDTFSPEYYILKRNATFAGIAYFIALGYGIAASTNLYTQGILALAFAFAGYGLGCFLGRRLSDYRIALYVFILAPPIIFHFFL